MCIYIYTHIYVSIYIYIYIYIYITLFGIEEPKVFLPQAIFSITHTTNSDCSLSYFGASTLCLDYIDQPGNSVCLEDCMKQGNAMCEWSTEIVKLKLVARTVTTVFSKGLNGYSGNSRSGCGLQQEPMVTSVRTLQWIFALHKIGRACWPDKELLELRKNYSLPSLCFITFITTIF